MSRVKAFERDYPNLIPVPVPVNHLQGTAFSKNGGIELRGWESLRGYTIGITRGMKFAERGTAGMVIIKKLKFEGIHALEPPLVRVDLYHFLHKRHAALVPKITESIRKLEASGRIEEIRKQFFQGIAKAPS